MRDSSQSIKRERAFMIGRLMSSSIVRREYPSTADIIEVIIGQQTRYLDCGSALARSVWCDRKKRSAKVRSR